MVTRGGPWLVALACAACDGGSGLAGDYELLSFALEQGGCTGAFVDQLVPERDRWFRLADVERDDGWLVAFYGCTALAQCDPVYDLAQSFGEARDGEGWAGYVASAIPAAAGCTLGFRVRRLESTDAGVLIIEELYRMTDDTLVGDACSDRVASERGTTMPCAEQSERNAEER